MSTITYCDQCGTSVAGSASFCMDCGSALPALSPQPTSKAATTPDSSSDTRTGGSATPSLVALRGVVTPQGRGRRRSKAWVYYAILAVFSLLTVFTGKPIGLVGTLLCGAYSYYIYQGGRIVIWFW